MACNLKTVGHKVKWSDIWDFGICMGNFSPFTAQDYLRSFNWFNCQLILVYVYVILSFEMHYRYYCCHGCQAEHQGPYGPRIFEFGKKKLVR